MGEGGRVEGSIESVLPRGLYLVAVPGRTALVAGICVEARGAIVRLRSGDRVVLEVTARDPNQGRIVAKL